MRLAYLALLALASCGQAPEESFILDISGDAPSICRAEIQNAHAEGGVVTAQLHEFCNSGYRVTATSSDPDLIITVNGQPVERTNGRYLLSSSAHPGDVIRTIELAGEPGMTLSITVEAIEAS